jgi:hypothetical protein
VKVGDLVRSMVSQNGECTSGLIVKLLEYDTFDYPGAMILWEHGEVCYSPLDELEILNECR